MDMEEDIRPVTVLKTRAADLLDQINETHRPVVITQKGKPRGVLQDVESYEKTRQTLLMLKLLAHGEGDVRAGRTIPDDEVFARIRKRLEAKNRAHTQRP